MVKTHADLVTDCLRRLFKEERRRLGLGHQALADAAGINRSTVSLIESGKRTPTITVCLKIAGALGADFAEMLKTA